MSVPLLVSTGELAELLAREAAKVVDATWYLPTLRRDARAEHASARIPGAVFFDIDAIADRASALPHMLPGPEEFGRHMGELGLAETDRIVVYGARHMIASARAWWTLRVFGHAEVAVLDGGFPKWRAEGRPLDTGPAVLPPPARYRSRPAPHLVADLGAMRANLTTRAAQVVDARSQGRFLGTEPEPRPGLRGGHIPGSLSLPYDRLFRSEGGTLRPPDELRAVFAEAGVDPARPVVATCGSGVSACVLAVGLAVLGEPGAAVYDGSWTEWASHTDTPAGPKLGGLAGRGG